MKFNSERDIPSFGGGMDKGGWATREAPVGGR